MASRRNNYASHLMKAHKRVLPDIGEVECLPILKSFEGNSHRSEESEVISRYLSQVEVAPLIESGDSNPRATPTLESLPNSEGMNVPTLENGDTDSTLPLPNLANDQTSADSGDSTMLREVIRGEAERILSRVLGAGNLLASDDQQQAKKSHASSESSDSSGRITKFEFQE